MLSKYFPLPVSCSLYSEFVDRNAIQVGFFITIYSIECPLCAVAEEVWLQLRFMFPLAQKDCMGTTAPPSLRLIVQLVL